MTSRFGTASRTHRPLSRKLPMLLAATAGMLLITGGSVNAAPRVAPRSVAVSSPRHFAQGPNTITLVGEPNPQFRNENVGLYAEVCGANNATPTGNVRFDDLSTKHSLGASPLLGSEDAGCGGAVLNTRALAVGRHFIKGTYLPSGRNPAKGIKGSVYIERILKGGEGNHVSTFAGGLDVPHAMKGGTFYNHPQGGDSESNDHP